MIINVNQNAKDKNALMYLTAKELQSKDIPEPRVIVEGMLYQGLSVIASQPKIGKSWLALNLSICVANGQDFLNHSTTKGDCLYLALEDSMSRLKIRLISVLGGENAPDNLFIATLSKTLENGLLEQLNDFISFHPNTKLIIIDTLQKVRGNMKFNESAYGNDYKEVGALKQFADKHNIAIVLIHHLRKAKDKDDVFNQISGTNGIAGAADTMIVLSKKYRTAPETTLSITGRDIDEFENIIIFDKVLFKWKVIQTQEELQKIQNLYTYENDPVVIALKKLLKENPKGIQLTASELLKEINKITKVEPKQSTPSSLSRHLKSIQHKLQENDNIFYSPPSANGGSGGRKHYFCISIKEDNNLQLSL